MTSQVYLILLGCAVFAAAMTDGIAAIAFHVP
jgi:hypothetical protein